MLDTKSIPKFFVCSQAEFLYLYKLMVCPRPGTNPQKIHQQVENELGLPIPRGRYHEGFVSRSPARSNLFITNLPLLYDENMRSLRVFKGIYVGP